MKKLSKKNIIIISIIIVVIIVSALICFLNNSSKSNDSTQDGIKYDVSIIPDGIKVKNEKVEIQGEELNFSASVKNTTNQAIYVKEIEVVIRDSEKNILADLLMNIDGNIEANSSLDISGTNPVTNGVKYNEVMYIFNTEKTSE